MFTPKRDPNNGDALGTGRRKTSVARVRVRTGAGVIKINQRDFEEYFPSVKDRLAVTQVLEAVGKRNDLDVIVSVAGGGTTGQAGACRMGMARALVSLDAELFAALRDGGFLTRDSRAVERKKYGLRGARRGTQFSKR